MPESTVRIGLVLPDVMGTYGDGGNAVVLRQRLRLRGIDAEIVEITLADPVPDVARPLHARRRRGLRAAAGHPAPDPSTPDCSRPPSAARRCWRSARPSRCSATGTRRRRANASTASACSTSPRRRSRRAPSAKWSRQPLLDGLTQPLTGFENHRGGTILGPEARAAWPVTSGAGNRGGDGFDGAVQGSVIATYLHGPCLARNPELADLLLSRVVGDLAPLELAEVELAAARTAGRAAPGLGREIADATHRSHFVALMRNPATTRSRLEVSHRSRPSSSMTR